MSTEKTPTAKERRRAASSPKTAATSPPAATGDGKVSPRRRASTRRADMNRELASELRVLRARLREMIERYELHVGGRLQDLIRLLEGDPSIAAPPQPLPTKVAQSMLEQIRETRLKPQKGRARDFRRLQKVVEDLAERTGER